MILSDGALAYCLGASPVGFASVILMRIRGDRETAADAMSGVFTTRFLFPAARYIAINLPPLPVTDTLPHSLVFYHPSFVLTCGRAFHPVFIASLCLFKAIFQVA